MILLKFRYICVTVLQININSSAGHHEQKNKYTAQIKFSVVTIRQQVKLVLDVLYVNKC